MAKFGLQISVIVTKDGQPFYEEGQKSHNLDEQQFTEMEQDLFDLKKKWAAASGLKA
jgi:hypothetical protein